MKRIDYIAFSRDLFSYLHPSVWELIDIIQSQNYHHESNVMKATGFYFRKHVTDTSELRQSGRFWTHVRPFTSFNDLLESLNKPYSNLEAMDAYAFSINQYVSDFISFFGINSLPWSKTQQLYFRVDPDGRWSKTATAIYCNQYRIGYLSKDIAPGLLKRFSKKQIESAIGIPIVPQVSDNLLFLTMMIPNAEYVQTHPELKAQQPSIIYQEDSDYHVSKKFARHNNNRNYRRYY